MGRIPPPGNAWDATRPPNVVPNNTQHGYGYPQPPPGYPHGQISTMSYPPRGPPPAYQSQGPPGPGFTGPTAPGAPALHVPPPSYTAANSYPSAPPSNPPTDTSYPSAPMSTIPTSTSPVNRRSSRSPMPTTPQTQ